MEDPRWQAEPLDPERDLPPDDHHAQPEEDPPDLDPEDG